MIIVLKPDCTAAQVKSFTDSLTEEYKVKVNTWVGTHSTVLGLIGDTSVIDIEYIAAQDVVDSVKRVQEPYKKANRKFHPDNTVITLPGGQKIGGGNLCIMAGPCSVETEEQICYVAERVKAAAPVSPGRRLQASHFPLFFPGASCQRTGASPKSQGTHRSSHCNGNYEYQPSSSFEDVDIIQVGARNMQNFELLKELGKLRKPILLKRGLANTIEETLMSAEYIMGRK